MKLMMDAGFSADFVRSTAEASYAKSDHDTGYGLTQITPMKTPKKNHDWDALMRYLRTSYQATDITMTTEVASMPGHIRLDVTFNSGAKVGALITPAMQEAAADDFQVIWKALDESIGNQLEEVRKGKKIRHPDDLLIKRAPAPVVKSEPPPQKPLDEWDAATAQELVEMFTEKEQSEHPIEVPDLTQWVLGYREWSDGGRPLTYGDFGGWNGPYEVRAKCAMRKGHAAPAGHCDCGFYAYDSLSRVSSVRVYGAPVAGVIRARGVMYTAKEGFRAEYAQPLALGYRDEGDRAKAEKQARQWGLPCLPIGFLPEFAKDYGSPMPDSLKPIEKWETIWRTRCSCGREDVVIKTTGKRQLDDTSETVPSDPKARERLVNTLSAVREMPCGECGLSLHLAEVIVHEKKLLATVT